MEYCYPIVKQKLTHEEKTLREVNYYINVLKKAQPGDFLCTNFVAYINAYMQPKTLIRILTIFLQVFTCTSSTIYRNC